MCDFKWIKSSKRKYSNSFVFKLFLKNKVLLSTFLIFIFIYLLLISKKKKKKTIKNIFLIILWFGFGLFNINPLILFQIVFLSFGWQI